MSPANPFLGVGEKSKKYVLKEKLFESIYIKLRVELF
jgi:hypothetical protein